MKSILQDWVQRLGLRHQGCLISATRGCDGVPKDDVSKGLIRALRFEILVPHCGDAAKASSYIEKVTHTELLGRMQKFVRDFDHYPVHFLLHVLHAAEIIGYYDGRSDGRGYTWRCFYEQLCHKMHVMPEGMDRCATRLNANEDDFAKADKKPIRQYPDPPQRTAAEAKEHIAETEAVMKFLANPNAFKDLPTKNDNGRIIGRPCHEQLPEALNKGFFDYKAFHVGRASNHYAGAADKSLEQLWDIGWLAANRTKRMHAEPRPREEGYDGYYDGLGIYANPYQSIAIASGEWHTGWKRAEMNERLQRKRAADLGHICDGNRGHCAGDCPDSEENKMAGFDSSGFYDDHKPSVKELDDMAASQYRGVRS